MAVSLGNGMGIGLTLPAAQAGRPFGGRRPGVAVALASKGAAAGAKAEEKGILDWILGGLQKDDQLLETDPILNKVQAPSSVSSVKSKPAAPKTNDAGGGAFGGFGGLFAKK